MNLSDVCVICQASMLRKPVVRLKPCDHCLHKSCLTALTTNDTLSCPICRSEVTHNENVVRRVNSSSSLRDRQIVIEAANRGDDWVSLAENLNVKYATAYSWIKSGKITNDKRGGQKPKKITEEIKAIMLTWIEEKPTISLQEIKGKLALNFGVDVSLTTVGNYLEGSMYTIKQVHFEPITMNSEENKIKRYVYKISCYILIIIYVIRRDYVQQLNDCIGNSKQIMWLDETNFNLFLRRKCGRSRVGTRAIVTLPAARGPNVHLIGAMTCNQIFKITRRRGSFTCELANQWVRDLLAQWIELGKIKIVNIYVIYFLNIKVMNYVIWFW